MKDPKVVQADKRGQIVIPKSIRKELGIEEGAAFWMYKTEEGIFLKRIEAPSEKAVKKAVKKAR
ncbi:AbrB/MazE/SpoVT family DNA-binding domain-containing protein [Candidatus Woesearchaeota archaeon]|nr:AbrB/MazE/SpoVT family DNA-binding domain-containing protein [Candidatus Woesearchaeota archaeon]